MALERAHKRAFVSGKESGLIEFAFFVFTNNEQGNEYKNVR